MKPDLQKAEQKAKELHETGADCPLQILKKLKNQEALKAIKPIERISIKKLITV